MGAGSRKPGIRSQEPGAARIYRTYGTHMTYVTYDLPVETPPFRPFFRVVLATLYLTILLDTWSEEQIDNIANVLFVGQSDQAFFRERNDRLKMSG